MSQQQKFYIYSKSGCGYCDRLVQFMESKGIDHEKFELNTDFTVEQFQMKFGRSSTFPQVNYKNENLGGMKDTVRFIMKQNMV